MGLNVSVVPAATAAECTGNAIVCENQLPGNDPSEWDIDGAGDDSIQGFATQMSVNHGETIDFKIKTDASSYTIKIFRLGYYQGKGARKIADVTPSASLPQIQPACVSDPATEIYDCGTWGVSASWQVPSNAVSGVYIALLERPDNGGVSHITFVVRDDGNHSTVVYQTSDTTWQAYNTYGGSSFYVGQGNGRAYKLSYNRPFATRSWENGRDFLFSNEVPMIRFLESNGYDLSYISGLDTDIRGSELTNHKTFLSVGHDEYWSAGQRTNVEAARDAGVNLAFFSGNEVYWKTRWEPSEDGSNTPNRTLVCYKDTWANVQIDPSGPTATWRDPRFGDNGHGPENALTGTAYVSNISTVPITVSAAEGSLRVWRNTGLDHPANGVSTDLQPLGYESDEDLDNGYRPAGLIHLSTGTGPVPDYLQDFGNVVAPGTTTHHLTMYRAASGSLVFSAGTVQWSWGLDVNHDGTRLAVDTRMQQATVNILADMDALPTTLSTAGIVAATKSTDSTPPTAVITAPANGSAISQGSTVTVTGTATDAGGGVVGGVEVSLDGGTSWHPAVGTNSFTYTGVVTGTGSSVIQARAIDDSGNIQSAPARVSSDVQCPCSIFGNATPKVLDGTDGSPVTLGVKFTASADGFITGIRFYKSTANTGTHTGALYRSDGTLLSTVTFTDETANGWQVAAFPKAVPISAGVTYVASYRAPNGHYSADAQFFAYRGATGGPLTAVGGYANPNGVYTTGTGMPNLTYQQMNYYVDALYSPTDTTPLTVTSLAPMNGVSSVPVTSGVSATFSRPPSTGSVQFAITDPSGQIVPGDLAYDAGSMTSTLTPTSPLAPDTTYQVSVTASAPDIGAMAQPATWNFRTAKADGVSGVCPCTLFNDSDAPSVTADSDPNSVELGVAFSPDVDGQISGVRFYKGIGNDGPHTVSLWSSSGVQLATASVGPESVAGWQEATFVSPVNVLAGTSYIASYRAPSGHYAFSADGFAAPIDRTPLHTAANAGRYTYGTGAPLNQYSANYYVDPVFTVNSTSAPIVTSVSPVDQTSSIPVSAIVSVKFSTTVQPGSASIVVTDSTGTPVQGTLSNQTLGAVATFTPSSALTPGITYTVTVSGAKNLGGTTMAAPAVSTFTTAGITGCPCSVLASSATPSVSDSTDQSAVSVGLQFEADTGGYITGLRYYRDAANTGSHTGSLYSASGALLGTLTYSDTGTGWQTAQFASPIPITAGTTYVASTYMPNGHYSFTPAFFGSPYVNPPLTGLMGVYSYGGDVFPTSSYNGGNYFVDVTFSTQDPASVAVPEAPSNVSAQAENGSAAVSWTAPANGGSPITRYTVTPYSGSSALPPTTISGSNPATSTTVGGLTNGTPYTFTVSASNAKGVGSPSSPSPSVTPMATVPGAPVGVFAAAGDGQASVSWTAPVSDGGSGITGYTVTPFLGGVPQQSTDTGSTSATVASLSNGSTYTFRVVARNAIGSGPESVASNAATPVGLPGAPMGVSASAGNASASVSWVAPANTGGTSITGYVVTPLLNGVAQNATTVTGNPPATTVVIGGLANGSSYTFTVAAVNSVGQGGSSDQSTAVTPATTPGAPAGVTAAAGNGRATVSWTPPASDGGSPITSYVITPYVGTTPQGTKTVAGTPPATTAVVDSLTNGVSYTFTVTAANAAGSGSPSTASTAVTPALPTAPGAPGNVIATPGNATATVTWSAPSDGGSAITGYTVTPYVGSSPQTTKAVQVAAPSTTANIVGLTNGTSYTFQVRATNAVGTGNAGSSAPATPATTPNAPTITSATGGDASVTLAWSTPGNGGSQITGYVVTPYVGPVAQTSRNVTSSPATISGLTNGTAYTFKVAAVNAMGTGAQSAFSSSATPAAVPGAPTNVVGVAGNASVALSWSAPVSDGGSAITAYTITRYVGGVAQGSPTAAGSGTSFTVTGLTNGTTYTFSVTAKNAKGTGPASPQSSGIKPFVPAFVQQQSARSPSTTAIAATPNSSLTAGNRIVVMVGVKNGTASAQSVSDSAGNVYTRVGAARAVDQTEMSIWTAPISAGAGTRPVITANSTGSAAMALAVMEYSGLSSVSDGVDQVKLNSGSLSGLGTAQSTQIDVGTNSAAEMAIGFYLDGGANRSIFVGSGFSQRINGSPNSSMEFFAEDQVTGAANTKYNSTFTVSGSVSGYVAATVVFKRSA